MSDTACVSAMSAAFLPSLGHPGCDHGVPADPTATRLSRPRPGFPDRDPGDPTATWLTRRHPDQHNGILAVGFSTSLLTRRRPGCSDDEPATRFSRRDPVIPTATRLTRRHLYQHNDILAVRRFSHRDRVPDTMTESWLCSGRAGSVPAVQGSVPIVRLCPRHTGRVLAVPTVSWCVSSKCETKIFGRSSSPVLHTPFVTLLSILVTGTNCNELGVIWPISHKILGIITRSCIIT